MKKATKALLIAIGVIIFLIVIDYIIAIGAIIYSGYNTVSKTDTDFSYYQMYCSELHYAEGFLPAEDELIYAKDLHFSYQQNYKLIFISKTVALTVQYAPEEYMKARERITQRYAFLDAPMLYHRDNDYLLDNAFTYKGYDFCVVSYDGCRYFGMVGTNDDTCSIAYLYYSDTDRDLIARADENLDQEMCALIDDEFFWEPFTE